MKNIAMLMIVLLVFGWMLAGQAREPEPPERYSLYLVQPGDTLWGISRVNGLQGAIIRPGDILNVPDPNGVLLEPLGPEYSSIEAAQAAERELAKLLGR